MRRPTKRDERGLVGIILTMVIVWALIGAVELTRTLRAAQSIDSRVKNIEASVSGANSHLNTGCNQNGATNCATALPVLSTTEGIVAKIDTAAQPLSAEAGQIITAAKGINTTAASILATAADINGVVHSIGNAVQGIGSTTNSISSNFSGINADTDSLQPAVADINRKLDFLNSVNVDIKTNTANINRLTGEILIQAQGICADSLTSVALHLNIGLLKVC